MLQKGDVYPLPKDTARIQKQNNYERLLNSKSFGNFKLKSIDGRISREAVDPLVPLPQTISDISSDLLMGESPKITIPKDQDDLNDWIFDTNLESKLLEGATYASSIGSIFSRMYKNEEEILYDFVAANNVTFTRSLNVLTNVKFIDSIRNTKNSKGKLYNIQEYDLDKNEVTISTYTAQINKSTNKVEEITNLKSETPGLDFIPVTQWVNIGIMGSDFGRSDYQGKEQLFAEIDNRIDQNNNVLEENAAPWLGMPPGILNQNGELNKSSSDNKMFEKAGSGNQGENSIDIIEWDGQLKSSFEQLTAMEDLVFFTSRISNSISGRTTGGTSDSGRSLKWQSVSTIAMINRKKRYASDFLKTFINQWTKLRDKEIVKKDIKVEFQDGLPLDDKEVIESTVKQFDSGLMSQETAIKNLQETDDLQTQEEIARIQSDQQFQTGLEVQASSPITL